MAKVELKAVKTFYNNGKFTIAGDTFKVDEYQANAYISRQLAERVGSQEAKKSAAVISTKSTDYDNFTVNELKKLAKEKGISGFSSMTKGELITAFTNYETKEGPL